MATKGGTLLYGGETGSSSKGASEFISKLLHGVTAVHMHHITVNGTGSYAKHSALGDLYDELSGAVDSLAESFIGCTGESLAFTPGSFDMAADPVAEVQKLYDYVEGSRKAMGSESHIQNEVDEICSLLARSLYKLRRLA